MNNPDWKNLLRLTSVKILAVIIAVVFFSLGVLFLTYCVISVGGTTKGGEAKIIAVSQVIGEHPSACRWGGLFTVVAETSDKKPVKIYCLYPAWPDVLNPVKGDIIRVWPVKQPRVGAVPLDGWGWFIVGTLLIVGLVMFEFAFLALTIH